MVKLLFVLMNEYRLWALPQALAALERRYPGAVEGRVYSVREINADAGLERALLADGAAADMAFLASHGSIQNLYCFSRLWEALEGRPVYFTSTMGDELAELLPRLGLEPALYAALDSYYQAGSPADLEGLVLCALNGRFGGDYPLSPPSPPRGQGLYTLEGFLPPEREAGYRARMAAETRPVIGVLIHDHYARTGNLEHVDALLRAIQARGGRPIRPVRLLRRRPRDGAGHPLPDGAVLPQGGRHPHSGGAGGVLRLQPDHPGRAGGPGGPGARQRV